MVINLYGLGSVMAYINYSQVAANRAYGKSLKPTITTKDFNSISWELAEVAYTDAADAAEELEILSAKSASDARYELMLAHKVNEWELANPESGAYEGNMSDEHPRFEIVLPDKGRVRRKAGNAALVTNFVEMYGLKGFATTLLPQIITHLAGKTLQKNESGLISGLRFCKDNLSSPRDRGLWRFLMLDSRSSYLETMYKSPSKSYCPLVPLILYAHKLVHGVPYSAWDPEELHYVVNDTLCKAMLYRPDAWPDKSALVEGRDKGLTVGSGKDAGKVRNPISTYKLYATTGTCYQGMPEYAQVMLAQIWCAHPENRTKYMVLDPVKWDSVPAPLITSTNLFSDPKQTQFMPTTVTKPINETWGA